MTAEQFIWAWLRSEMLEPKELKFEDSNYYYAALKDTIEGLQTGRPVKRQPKSRSIFTNGRRPSMIKTIKTMSKQEKERYTVPRKVQDVIPVRRIWPDGIFLTGNRFSKTYRFSDINYLVASREDKESMFLTYSELLNSLDSGAVTKITINNRRLNKANFETSILMPIQGDFRDEYRGEYNQMLLDKATGANGIMQEKYITISVVKKDVEEARAYFARVGADLISHFAALGSKCVELDATERLRILHDFYRQGEESEFVFNAREMMKRGHSFKDYICPDGIEKNSDYLKLGDKFCRVLFLKDYASYIKDNMVTELTTWPAT